MAILESWSHLHLSVCLTVHLSMSPFPSVFYGWSLSLSRSVSPVFYSCCKSHLTFLLGDYFIMRPQLPPSLSASCSPPLLPLLITVHVSFLLFKITFITSVWRESTVESGMKWLWKKSHIWMHKLANIYTMYIVGIRQTYDFWSTFWSGICQQLCIFWKIVLSVGLSLDPASPSSQQNHCFHIPLNYYW